MSNRDFHVCRLIFDAALGGAWNMAVDEVLLASAAEENRPTLRFYEWSEPTLSLGYFQCYEDRLAHRASRNCAVVRRSTGGGAILHDHELTYSLAMPVAHPLAQDTSVVYRQVHEGLIAVLSELRVRAGFAGARPAAEPEPFLCFLRRTDLDVLCDENKICGSAQRKSRGGVLQHGSVLFGKSNYAPELPGLRELADQRTAPRDFARLWAKEMSARMGLPLNERGLSSAEMDSARELTLQKHTAQHWLRKR